MAATYKTILAEAVKGFNKIQNALSENSATGISAINGTGVANSTVTNLSTADQMVAGIKKLTKNGTCTVSGGTLSKGTASGGGLSVNSNFSSTPDVNISLVSADTNTTGVYLQNAKPTSGYYVRIGATSTEISGTTSVSRAAFSQTVTRADIKEAHTSGYIADMAATTSIGSTSTTVSLGSATATPTVTINAGKANANEYLVIPSGSASATVDYEFSQKDKNGTTVSILSETAFTEGDYYKFTVSPTAVLNKTAGFISSGNSRLPGSVGFYYLKKGSVSTETDVALLTTSVNGALLSGTITTQYISVSTSITKNEGYIDSELTQGTLKHYKIKSGSATTPTNSTALLSKKSTLSTDSSGSTLTVEASVTPTVSAGWVSSGTAGTVKIKGTIPTETKTASASGDITPTSGKLLTKVTVPSGGISNSATPDVTYTDQTLSLSNGYLYINKGWIDNTKISLGSLIPDISSDATADYILSGFKAYNDAGTVITGNIKTLSLSDTYFTTTNTGYGVVTAKKYTGNTTKYIKKGGAYVSTAQYNGDNVTLNYLKYSNGNASISLSSDDVAATVHTAGWIDSSSEIGKGNVNFVKSITGNTFNVSGSGDHTPTNGTIITKVSVPSGSATTPTNSTALSSSSSSLSLSSNTYSLTVQANVTPTVSAGWVSSGTAGTVKIKGTVPTETKTASAAGDVTPTSGKLLSKVTVPSGSITVNNPTSSVTHGTVTPSISFSDSYEAAQYGFTTSKPSSGSYLTIDPGASYSGGSVTSSVSYSGTAGWISAISSTSKNSSTSTSISPTIANGTNYYIPSAGIVDNAGIGDYGSTYDSSKALYISDVNGGNGISFYLWRDYSTTAGVIPRIDSAMTYTQETFLLNGVNMSEGDSFYVNNQQGELTINNMAATVNFTQNDVGSIVINGNYGAVTVKNNDDYGAVDIQAEDGTDLIAPILTSLSTLEAALTTLGVPTI